MREKADLSGAILDGLGTPVCVVDGEGRVIRWNHAAAALTGISSERICGHGFPETLLLPSDFDDWRRELERIYEDYLQEISKAVGKASTVPSFP